jgi:hypothetical protein
MRRASEGGERGRSLVLDYPLGGVGFLLLAILLTILLYRSAS